MREEAKDVFINIPEEKEKMDEEAAREIFEKMKSREDGQISEKLIKEFKEQTDFSIRKIAAISGVNKDKVNKLLKK